MSTILDIGRAALQGASAMALAAAHQIANASVQGERLAPPAPHHSGQTVLAPGRVYADPMVEGLVTIRLAEAAYRAGAAIIRTETEMQDELLRAV